MNQNDLITIFTQIEGPFHGLSQKVCPALRDSAWTSWARQVGMPLIKKTIVWEYHLFTQQPGENHSSFVHALKQGEITKRIVSKYPVIVNLYRLHMARLRSQLELVQSRLEQDKNLIQERMSAGRPLGELTKIEWGLSDRHAGGQQVHIFHFENLKIVYKPRSLEADARFQGYLKWINKNGIGPAQKTLGILCRDDYGWTEFIEHQEIDDPDQLGRYYYRFGSLLGVLYSLGAIDFHHENLIAHGEFPVLIDLESCLQPMRKSPQVLQSDSNESSVLDTAMLPSRLWNYQDSVEVSALAAGSGDELIGTHEEIEGFEAGPLRLVQRHVRRESQKNRPDRLGRNPSNWAREIAQGYSDVYRLVLRNRDSLLTDSSGAIASMFSSRIRIFARNTATYFELLQGSYHPALLVNERTWQRHFDWLQDHSAGSGLPGDLWEYEAQSLFSGDVPYFSVISSTRDLSAHLRDKQQFWPDAFERSPMEQVKHRLNSKMSERDLDRQNWFIETSLALISEGTQEHPFDLRNPAELFYKLSTLGGVFAGDPIWLTVKSHQGQWAISKLGEQDSEILSLIERAIHYYYEVSQSQEAQDLLTRQRSLLEQIKERAPSSSTGSRSESIGDCWLRQVDRWIDLRDPRADRVFGEPIVMRLPSPKGVVTAGFWEGISGLLYLACRYRMPTLPSLTSKKPVVA